MVISGREVGTGPVSRTRSDTSWLGLRRFELTSTSNLLPPLSLAPLPAPRMLIFSMPLTSRTTSSLPVLAHERATSPLFQATAFAFRSFPPLLRPPLAFAPSSNKRHHHPPPPRISGHIVWKCPCRPCQTLCNGRPMRDICLTILLLTPGYLQWMHHPQVMVIGAPQGQRVVMAPAACLPVSPMRGRRVF